MGNTFVCKCDNRNTAHQADIDYELAREYASSAKAPSNNNVLKESFSFAEINKKMHSSPIKQEQIDTEEYGSNAGNFVDIEQIRAKHQEEALKLQTMMLITQKIDNDANAANINDIIKERDRKFDEDNSIMREEEEAVVNKSSILESPPTKTRLSELTAANSSSVNECARRKSDIKKIDV